MKVIRSKDKPCHERNFSESRFSITVLQVVSAAGVNVPLIFMVKGGMLHPRLIFNNLLTRYGSPEGSCVIPKISIHR